MTSNGDSVPNKFDVTRMDIDQFNSVARNLRSETDSLNTEFGRLKKFMDDRFGCWGNDDPGKQFGKQYGPAYQKFATDVQGMIDNLVKNAADISGIPDTFLQQETYNAQQLE